MRWTVDLLVRESALTARMLADVTGQLESTAHRNLGILESVGALKASGHIRGHKVWVAPDVASALDEFAAGVRKRVRA